MRHKTVYIRRIDGGFLLSVQDETGTTYSAVASIAKKFSDLRMILVVIILVASGGVWLGWEWNDYQDIAAADQDLQHVAEIAAQNDEEIEENVMRLDTHGARLDDHARVLNETQTQQEQLLRETQSNGKNIRLIACMLANPGENVYGRFNCRELGF